MTRPGIGLYGGLPYAAARCVVRLDVPVIQTREVGPGEPVGYGNSWTARAPARIATVAAGYADGLIRAMGPKAVLYCGETPCPVRGRVSMDLITVDVTHLGEDPDRLEILGERQGVDLLAEAAGTSAYEKYLTSSSGAPTDRAGRVTAVAAPARPCSRPLSSGRASDVRIGETLSNHLARRVLPAANSHMR